MAWAIIIGAIGLGIWELIKQTLYDNLIGIYAPKNSPVKIVARLDLLVLSVTAILTAKFQNVTFLSWGIAFLLLSGLLVPIIAIFQIVSAVIREMREMRKRKKGK